MFNEDRTGSIIEKFLFPETLKNSLEKRSCKISTSTRNFEIAIFPSKKDHKFIRVLTAKSACCLNKNCLTDTAAKINIS